MFLNNRILSSSSFISKSSTKEVYMLELTADLDENLQIGKIGNVNHDYKANWHRLNPKPVNSGTDRKIS